MELRSLTLCCADDAEVMKATAIAPVTLALLTATGAASPDSPMELPVAATLVVVEGTQGPLVRLTLLNLSAHPVGAASRPAIMAKARNSTPGASADEYWAPVGFSGRPYSPNETPYLALEPGQETMLSIDLGQLKWARRRSSQWPRRSLAEVVPHGEYDLWYEVALVLEPPFGVASGAVVLRLP